MSRVSAFPTPRMEEIGSGAVVVEVKTYPSLVRLSLRARLRVWWRRRWAGRRQILPGLTLADLDAEITEELYRTLIFGPRETLLDRLAPYSLRTKSLLVAEARWGRMREYATRGGRDART